MCDFSSLSALQVCHIFAICLLYIYVPQCIFFVKENLIYLHIKSVSKWKLLLNNCYEMFSGHFFAICIFIFHKTEVQTVILRCLTGLNLNWFKSYGLRCNLRPKASSANSQKIATDKRPFYDHIWPLFCQPHVYLSQNWDSDGHFEVLNESKS